MGFRALQSLVLLVAFAADVAACPRVANLPDWNCDGAIKVVVVGDSFVAGVGDTAHNNRGGYVLRAQASLPNVTVQNFGVPGLDTVQLLLNLNKAFSGRSYKNLAVALDGADLVILDIGRNDFWSFGPPIQTFRRLKKAVSLIKTKVTSRVGEPPVVVTAVLMLPNRTAQGIWVKELDGYIEKSDSSEAPADLRFDAVQKRLTSSDQLHPTPVGYGVMAAILVRYINSVYPGHVHNLRG